MYISTKTHLNAKFIQTVKLIEISFEFMNFTTNMLTNAYL